MQKKKYQSASSQTKIKPVQPTVIKSKVISEQIVCEVRRKPTKAQLTKMKKQNDIIMSMIKQ